INKLLQTNTFTGAVLSQTVKTDSELEALAAEYGITTGKAQLIQSIIAQNTTYEFSALVSLSINELNLLIATAGSVLENVDSIGSASDKAYIGYEKAIDIALSDIGADASTIIKKKAELHADDGIMVYEIELVFASYEYEYEINALNGAIIEKDVDKTENDDSNDDVSSSEEAIISAVEAKYIALTHAGADADTVTEYKCEYDSGAFEIEFVFNNGEYEYEIDAYDGSIIDHDIEYNISYDDADDDDDDDNDDVSRSSVISETQAKNAALAHAGADANEITGFLCELDEEIYEIEFNFGTYEYNYDISAADGRVLHSERETDGNSDLEENSVNHGAVSALMAKSVALANASLSENAISDYVCELDDGVYEIEFTAAGYSYEYEISISGEILNSNKEIDD
ncbi:MAG TPA: PepSY domain-containing protein, partial [Bacillota bacterium]|nr:PepSY domain-containing protein [Bacillota bacterium]